MHYTANFHSEEAEAAEDNFDLLIEKAEQLGYNVKKSHIDQTNEQLIKNLKLNHPDRLEIVSKKLQKMGISIDDLSQDEFLDKVLAIDKMFEFQGKKVAVDIATGRSSTIINKRKKMLSLKEVYQKLGIDIAMVLKSKETISEELIFDILLELESLIGDKKNYIELRYNTNERYIYTA